MPIFSDSPQDMREFFTSISASPVSHEGLPDVTGLMIFVGVQWEAQDGRKLI